MSGNGTRDPDRILAQIQETRSEMDSTLRAIESRLTPGELIDQGLNYLRRSGGREFVENLGTSLKTNPLPATLVGIGLAWLMVAQQTGRTAAPASREDADTDNGSITMESFASAVSTARERVSETAESIGTTADRISASANRARERVSATADRARDAWNATTASTRQQIDRARSQYRHMLREQPLALGFVGVGLGALLAASMPRTRQEDELMGSASDEIKQRIGDVGREQLQKVGEAGREQLQKVSEAASDATNAGSRSDGDTRPSAADRPSG